MEVQLTYLLDLLLQIRRRLHKQAGLGEPSERKRGVRQSAVCDKARYAASLGPWLLCSLSSKLAACSLGREPPSGEPGACGTPGGVRKRPCCVSSKLAACPLGRLAAEAAPPPLEPQVRKQQAGRLAALGRKLRAARNTKITCAHQAFAAFYKNTRFLYNL